MAHAPMVLMVTGEFPPFTTGGLGTHVSLLVSELSRRGATIDVLVPGFGARAFPDAEKTETFSACGATAHRVAASPTTLATSRFDPARGQRYVEDMQTFALSLRKPDIVHCHDWHLFGAARAIARATSAKLIVTIHLLYHPTFGYWGQRLPSEIVKREAEACREADAVITVSEAMRRLILETHGLAEDRVHAVHNGVEELASAADEDALRALRTELAPEGAKLVVYAGRITAQKGVLPLLRSASSVVREMPNVRYALVGPVVEPMPTRVDTAAEIEKLLAADPALGERVVKLGAVPRERLLDVYRVADLAVVPSVYEPFGYAATEAMGAALPVVASDVGGLSEIVVHGVTGALCPVHVSPTGIHEVDVDALAAAQLEILRDPERGRRMGEAGRERVRDVFSAVRMADGTLEAYGRVTLR